MRNKLNIRINKEDFKKKLDIKDGNDGSPDTGPEIVVKINNIPPTGPKIDASHIKNLSTFVQSIGVKRDSNGGGTGTGTPAGADGQVQFNDSGAFGASANLTWDDATGQLQLANTLRLVDTTASDEGVIYKGANRFIHNFSHPTGDTAVPTGNNTFIGVNSGNFTLGSTATAVFQASANTGLGVDTLKGLTTGFNNMAIGGASLRAVTTGSNNTGVGISSLQSMTTGASNLAMGQGSMLSITGGNSNTAIGVTALNGSSSSISNNVAIGAKAGQNIDTGGNANVFIGQNNGNNLSTGIQNTFVGYNTGLGVTTGDYNTIIGANVTGLTADLSNNIIIADGEGNQRINVDENGNVGIGTVNPSNRLHVVDTALNATTNIDFATLEGTVTIFGNTTVYGLNSSLILDGTGSQTNAFALNGTLKIDDTNVSVGTGIGLRGETWVDAPSTLDSKTVIGLQGIVTVGHASSHNGGAITGVQGKLDFSVNPTTNSATEISAVMGDLSTLRVGVLDSVSAFRATEAVFTTGSVTNAYGYFCEEITGGTNNWAIYTNGATKSYFGGNVGIGETTPVTLTEWTGTAPYLTLHNSTEEDTDGGRESKIIARGEQSGTEETVLGEIEFSHDGASDDEKGKLTIRLNDGSDGTSPTDVLKIDSTGGFVFLNTAGLVYGGISAVGNSTETSIAVAGTAVQVTIFDTNSPNNNTTPDHTNDHITITKAGDYMINVSATVNSVAGVASRFEMTVQKNNGASNIGSLICNRNVGGGGAESGVISISGIATLAVNDTIEVWIENETNTQNYVIENIDISLMQIGG